MRTNDQNSVFHIWVREVCLKLNQGGVEITEPNTKEVLKRTLGNVQDVLSVECSVSTTKYKRCDADLTQEELDNGELSMESFLSEIQAWAAREINLELKTPNE